MMKSETIHNTMMEKIKKYCAYEDELKAVELYIETDGYRKKLIDILDMANEKGDKISHDQFMSIVIRLSYEEELGEDWRDIIAREKG